MTHTDTIKSTQATQSLTGAPIPSEELDSSSTVMLTALNELFGTVSARLAIGDINALGLSEQKAESLRYLKEEASRIMSEEIAGADNEYKQSLMSIAVDLQTLLTNIYEAQMDQSELFNKTLLKQSEQTEENMDAKIDEMLELVDAQSNAGEKPWWTYLVAAIIAVVGAVIAFFTAGAASALVGLLVATIMMSPIGDKLTESIATGIGGDEPDTGANIAATAIVAVLSTILSMGAGGFVAAGSSATKAAVSEGIKAGVKEGAARAVTTLTSVVDDVAGAADDIVAAADDIADIAGDAAATASKAASKVNWDTKAFTTGLGERFVGEAVSGFIGSGGLIQTIQAILEKSPGGEEFLHSEKGAIILAVVGILASIAGGLVATKAIGKGTSSRMDYLKAKGLTDTLGHLPKAALTALETIRTTATMSGGIYGIVSYVNAREIADIHENLAEVVAESTIESAAQNATFDLQKRMNSSYTAQTKAVSGSLSAALEAFGSAEAGLAQNMA